ncbi:MAG: hypothetical protein ACRC1M_08235 [Methanobacteriaceae archaeon]
MLVNSSLEAISEFTTLIYDGGNSKRQNLSLTTNDGTNYVIQPILSEL